MKRLSSLSVQTIVLLILCISSYTLSTLFVMYKVYHAEERLTTRVYQLAYERAKIAKQRIANFAERAHKLAYGLENHLRFQPYSPLDKLSEAFLSALAIQAVCLIEEDGEIFESLVQETDGDWSEVLNAKFAQALKGVVSSANTRRERGGLSPPEGLLKIGDEWWYAVMTPLSFSNFTGYACFLKRLIPIASQHDEYGIYDITSISTARDRKHASNIKIGEDVWLYFDEEISRIRIAYQDIAEQGDYFLEISLPMTLYQNGWSYSRNLFIAIYATTTLGILLLYFLLQKVLLSPLKRLSLDLVERVEAPTELEGRSSCRELKILTERINEMIKSGVRHSLALEELAYSDTLTHLKNRHYFMKMLTERLKKPFESGRSLALFLLNINDFKLVNEKFGYDAGDGALKTIALMLTDNLSGMEHISRLSDDEYAMMCECKGEDEARERGMQIIGLFSMPIMVGSHAIPLSLAVGSSLCPRDGKDRSTLFKHLDLAMKKAKQQKGSAYQSFDQSIENEMEEKSALEGDLRSAIATKSLELWYQPKLSIKKHKVTGCEALLRWNRGGQYIPPNKIIPVARASGLIIPLSLWVVAESVRAASVFEERGFSIPVSFNAPIEVVMHEDFLASLRFTIKTFDLPPGRLVLEITEDALVPNIERVGEVLSEVRDLGCLVSVDDFGTGYSSLSYLHRLQIDELKVDRSFVTRLPKEQVVVKTIVAMSKALGLDVVAEGVENYEQLHYLSSIGCDTIQGYVISRPQPLEQCMLAIRKINSVEHLTENNLTLLSESVV